MKRIVKKNGSISLSKIFAGKRVKVNYRLNGKEFIETKLIRAAGSSAAALYMKPSRAGITVEIDVSSAFDDIEALQSRYEKGERLTKGELNILMEGGKDKRVELGL